jgi:hypothetical protein
MYTLLINLQREIFFFFLYWYKTKKCRHGRYAGEPANGSSFSYRCIVRDRLSCYILWERITPAMNLRSREKLTRSQHSWYYWQLIVKFVRNPWLSDNFIFDWDVINITLLQFIGFWLKCQWTVNDGIMCRNIYWVRQLCFVFFNT